MTAQTLQLLGTIQVVWATGDPPRFRSPRAQALLAYLVVERRPIGRDHLAALFWPDKPLAKGRAGLRRELHNLVTLLPDCWHIDPQMAEFIPAGTTQVDLVVFRRLARQKKWPAAADLVRGDFLEGFFLADNLEFESWLMGERERWRQWAERVLLQAAQMMQAQGNYWRTRRYLTRLLRLLPWHEEERRLLMRLMAQRGDFAAALREYEQCRAVLAEELDVDPTEATTALYEQVKIAMSLPVHNLPPEATPFIGREYELERLQQRSDPILCTGFQHLNFDLCSDDHIQYSFLFQFNLVGRPIPYPGCSPSVPPTF